VLAGRDLEKGGTWFGMDRSGRFAAVTNYRGASPVPGGHSRGTLATDFLVGALPPAAFIDSLAQRADRYQGFSLLVGDGEAVCYFSNKADDHPARPATVVAPGVHGLSNHLLNTPWPKVERGRRALSASLPLAPSEREQLLVDALSDRLPPPDDALPAAGAPIAFERALAAPFIHAPERDYGTRCTTLLTITRRGEVEFVERTWDRVGTIVGVARHAFAIDP
jgi:uncharacterized protein with NRDE domain